MVLKFEFSHSKLSETPDNAKRLVWDGILGQLEYCCQHDHRGAHLGCPLYSPWVSYSP